eukprot:5821199-Pleurochrysis_carterae.AAC.6
MGKAAKCEARVYMRHVTTVQRSVAATALQETSGACVMPLPSPPAQPCADKCGPVSLQNCFRRRGAVRRLRNEKAGAPWHMKLGMTRWKVDSAYPKPLSPRQSCRKF